MLHRYETTKEPDGSFIIHDVPIFAEISRDVEMGDSVQTLKYDEAWINTAVNEAIRREKEQHHKPVLFVEHNRDGKPIREIAGFLSNQRAHTIQYDGKPTRTVYADLVITLPEIFEEIKRGQFPGISVEIKDSQENNPQTFTAAALLNSEPPALKFDPLLVKEPKTVSERPKSFMEARKTGATFEVVCFSEFPKVIAKFAEEKLLDSEIGESRKDMPQFKGKDVDKFLKELEDQGIKTTQGEISASFLKPTQEELDLEKVKAIQKEGKKLKPILVSSDLFILDGHHRWASVKDGTIEIIKIDLPMEELLKMTQEEDALFAEIDDFLNGNVEEFGEEFAQKPKITANIDDVKLFNKYKNRWNILSAEADRLFYNVRSIQKEANSLPSFSGMIDSPFAIKLKEAIPSLKRLEEIEAEASNIFYTIADMEKIFGIESITNSHGMPWFNYTIPTDFHNILREFQHRTVIDIPIYQYFDDKKYNSIPKYESTKVKSARKELLTDQLDKLEKEAYEALDKHDDEETFYAKLKEANRLLEENGWPTIDEADEEEKETKWSGYAFGEATTILDKLAKSNKGKIEDPKKAQIISQLDWANSYFNQIIENLIKSRHERRDVKENKLQAAIVALENGNRFREQLGLKPVDINSVFRKGKRGLEYVGLIGDSGLMEGVDKLNIASLIDENELELVESAKEKKKRQADIDKEVSEVSEDKDFPIVRDSDNATAPNGLPKLISYHGSLYSYDDKEKLWLDQNNHLLPPNTVAEKLFTGQARAVGSKSVMPKSVYHFSEEDHLLKEIDSFLTQQEFAEGYLDNLKLAEDSRDLIREMIDEYNSGNQNVIHRLADKIKVYKDLKDKVYEDIQGGDLLLEKLADEELGYTYEDMESELDLPSLTKEVEEVLKYSKEFEEAKKEALGKVEEAIQSLGEMEVYDLFEANNGTTYNLTKDNYEEFIKSNTNFSGYILGKDLLHRDLIRAEKDVEDFDKNIAHAIKSISSGLYYLDATEDNPAKRYVERVFNDIKDFLPDSFVNYYKNNFSYKDLYDEKHLLNEEAKRVDTLDYKKEQLVSELNKVRSQINDNELREALDSVKSLPNDLNFVPLIDSNNKTIVSSQLTHPIGVALGKIVFNKNIPKQINFAESKRPRELTFNDGDTRKMNRFYKEANQLEEKLRLLRNEKSEEFNETNDLAQQIDEFLGGKQDFSERLPLQKRTLNDLAQEIAINWNSFKRDFASSKAVNLLINKVNEQMSNIDPKTKKHAGGEVNISPDVIASWLRSIPFDQIIELGRTIGFAEDFFGKKFTKKEMIDRGSDGYLNHAKLLRIPINKLDGLEPQPSNPDTIDGKYYKGRKIENPIEVVYDAGNDKYMVFAGNHRIAQAKANGDKTIIAYVEPDNGNYGSKNFSETTPDFDLAKVQEQRGFQSLQNALKSSIPSKEDRYKKSITTPLESKIKALKREQEKAHLDGDFNKWFELKKQIKDSESRLENILKVDNPMKLTNDWLKRQYTPEELERFKKAEEESLRFSEYAEIVNKIFENDKIQFDNPSEEYERVESGLLDQLESLVALNGDELEYVDNGDWKCAIVINGMNFAEGTPILSNDNYFNVAVLKMALRNKNEKEAIEALADLIHRIPESVVYRVLPKSYEKEIKRLMPQAREAKFETYDKFDFAESEEQLQTKLDRASDPVERELLQKKLDALKKRNPTMDIKELKELERAFNRIASKIYETDIGEDTPLYAKNFISTWMNELRNILAEANRIRSVGYLPSIYFKKNMIHSASPYKPYPFFTKDIKPSSSQNFAESDKPDPVRKLQTVIVPKTVYDSFKDAQLAVLKNTPYASLENVIETKTSWRFRQRDPSLFDPDSFKTRKVEGLALVEATLKEEEEFDEEPEFAKMDKDDTVGYGDKTEFNVPIDERDAPSAQAIAELGLATDKQKREYADKRKSDRVSNEFLKEQLKDLPRRDPSSIPISYSLEDRQFDAPEGLPKYVEARKEIYQYDGSKWESPSKNFMKPQALASSLVSNEAQPIGEEMIKVPKERLKFAEKKFKTKTKELLDQFVKEKDPKREAMLFEELKESQERGYMFAESEEELKKKLSYEPNNEDLKRKLLNTQNRGTDWVGELKSIKDKALSLLQNPSHMLDIIPDENTAKKKEKWLKEINSEIEKANKIRESHGLPLIDTSDRLYSQIIRIANDTEGFAEDLVLTRIEEPVPQNKLSPKEKADLRQKKKELARDSDSNKKVRNIVNYGDVKSEEFDEQLNYEESLPDEVITREGENLVMYKFNTEEDGYQIKAIISPKGESLPIEEDEEAIFSLDMLVDPQPVYGTKYIENEEDQQDFGLLSLIEKVSPAKAYMKYVMGPMTDLVDAHPDSEWEREKYPDEYNTFSETSTHLKETALNAIQDTDELTQQNKQLFKYYLNQFIDEQETSDPLQIDVALTRVLSPDLVESYQKEINEVYKDRFPKGLKSNYKKEN